MNRYLEKLAKEFHSTTEVADNRMSSALGGAAIGGFTAHQLDSRLGSALQRHLVLPMLKADPRVPSEVIDRLSEKALKETNTVLDLGHTGGSPTVIEKLRPALSSQGPFYIPHQGLSSAQKNMDRMGRLQNKLHRLAPTVVPAYDGAMGGTPTFNKNYVNMPKTMNGDILAHELGHAVDFSKGNTALKRGVSQVGRRIHGVPSAILGGLALSNSDTRDYAWTVPVLAATPTLREELAANYHAAKMVRQAGGRAGMLKGIIGRNVLSYTIPAAAAAAALAGINKLRKDGEKVNPSDWIREE